MLFINAEIAFWNPYVAFLFCTSVSFVASTPSEDLGSMDPLGLTKMAGPVDKDRRSKKK